MPEADTSSEPDRGGAVASPPADAPAADQLPESDAGPRPAPDDAPAADQRDRPRRGGRTRWWTLTKVFLAIGIPVGTFLVFAIPPYQGLDEPNHFVRVWSITDGTLVPPTVHSGTPVVDIAGRRAAVDGAIRRHLEAKGVVVSGCVMQYISTNYDQAGLARPFSDQTFFSSPAHCAHSPNVFLIFDNTAINSPVAYAPLVVGVGVLRAVGAPLPVIFYGGRLCGMAAFLAIVALAIRLTPRGKGVLLVLGLLPMSLEGAAVFSADPMTEALSLLVVALAIRCCVDERARWGFFGALAAAAWALALCKEPYGLLALLVLLVPAARLTGRTRWGWEVTSRGVTAAKLAVVAVTGLLAAAWFAVGVRGVTLAADYPPGQIDQPGLTKYFEHHPVTLAHELVRTWLSSWVQQPIVTGMVSTLGFFRNQESSEYAPIVLVLVAFAMLIVAYHYEWGPLRSLATRQRVTAWLPVAVAALIVLLIYVEAAVRVNPPGALVVTPLIGGRLFLPILAPPVMTVALLRNQRQRAFPIGWVALGALVLATYLVLKVFVRFY